MYSILHQAWLWQCDSERRHQSGPDAPAAAGGGCGLASPVSVNVHSRADLQSVHNTRDNDRILSLAGYTTLNPTRFLWAERANLVDSMGEFLLYI